MELKRKPLGFLHVNQCVS